MRGQNLLQNKVWMWNSNIVCDTTVSQKDLFHNTVIIAHILFILRIHFNNKLETSKWNGVWNFLTIICSFVSIRVSIHNRNIQPRTTWDIIIIDVPRVVNYHISAFSNHYLATDCVVNSIKQLFVKREIKKKA